MVSRLTLTLEQHEYSALLKMAIEELRDPSDQVRYILLQELERRGLLPTNGNGANEEGSNDDREAIPA